MLSEMKLSFLPTSHVGSSHALCRAYINSSSSETYCWGFVRADRSHAMERDGMQSKRKFLGFTNVSSRFRMGRFSQRKAYSSARLLPVAAFNAAEYRRLQAGNEEEEEDDDLCPVECVKEFKTNAELSIILEAAKQRNALVVVDFFRTACGSCKYIEHGFIKLCKGAGDDEAPIIFLKHNVMDEYEEQSELAEKLKIKVVPLFHFYKDGQLLEAFPTREKTKILEAICKHASVSLKIRERSS